MYYLQGYLSFCHGCSKWCIKWFIANGLGKQQVRVHLYSPIYLFLFSQVHSGKVFEAQGFEQCCLGGRGGLEVQTYSYQEGGTLEEVASGKKETDGRNVQGPWLQASPAPTQCVPAPINSSWVARRLSCQKRGPAQTFE
jgi:hypothetical protein